MAGIAALRELRVAARDTWRVATTLGYGPRFLHSTGQLHKVAPNTVLGLQITAEDGEDVPIPSESYSFGTLKRAEALGDWQALRNHGRRALRMHLKRGAHLCDLTNEISSVLGIKSSAKTQKPGREVKTAEHRRH